MRVRFAPSPTGALHIGGVRTALYNYLLAKQQGGTFILRIEDTDQTRYVEGAEAYIVEALQWCGLTPDEGPGFGGDYGPYRQSERKGLYGKYAQQLLDAGHAYYAFDTPEELDARREAEKAKGNHGFRYDASTRDSMRNSISLGDDETARLLNEKVPYTVRLRIPSDEIIEVQDQIRGTVQFQSNELDDKVILKADGLPTYHLANIVDDHLMEITNVIRGEEWLPSTAHHVLLYRFLGWESEMPQFAHLPLILKPNAKGKLSKRDGAKLGIPVFPLAWDGGTPDDSFTGFREFGFDPAAANNFLAFLGWNPGTEQEIFDMSGLIEAFSIEKVSKSGARFDFDKAKWFNQQYIMAKSDETLAEELKGLLGVEKDQAWMTAFAGLMKERVQLYPEFKEKGYYFFEGVKEYEQKPIRKKWKPERRDSFVELQQRLQAQDPFQASELEALVKQFMADFEYGFGDVLPILRVALSGTTKGPGVFEMIELLGKEEVHQRLETGYAAFDEIIDSNKS